MITITLKCNGGGGVAERAKMGAYLGGDMLGMEAREGLQQQEQPQKWQLGSNYINSKYNVGKYKASCKALQKSNQEDKLLIIRHSMKYQRKLVHLHSVSPTKQRSY